MYRFARSPLADGLAAAALLLAAVASAAGLLVPDLYRDTEGWVRQARASDLTTLGVAVPLLAAGLWRARAGSFTAQLVAWGVLGYLVYGYAIFAFAVATNPMTPLHYAILGLSTWSLVVSTLAAASSRHELRPTRLPRRVAGWYLIVTAALFAVLWLGEVAGSIASGTTAPAVAELGLVANPVWALDLAFALPFFALAGVMLLRRHPLAVATALPALVFVVVMGLSILVIFAFDAAAGAAVPVPPMALIGVLVTAAVALTLLGLAPEGRGRRRTPLTLLARTAVVLEVLLALGALAGGAALILGPRGEILPLPVSLLVGSPFETYFVPGLVLFVVLGIGPLAVALLAVRRAPVAPALTVGVGLALLVWLAVQFMVVGFATDPPLQPIYLALGAFIAVVGGVWWRASTMGPKVTA